MWVYWVWSGFALSYVALFVVMWRRRRRRDIASGCLSAAHDDLLLGFGREALRRAAANLYLVVKFSPDRSVRDCAGIAIQHINELIQVANRSVASSSVMGLLEAHRRGLVRQAEQHGDPHELSGQGELTL